LISYRNEDVLLPAGIDDGIAWNSDREWPGQLESCGAVQAGSQHPLRVRNCESHPQRACPYSHAAIDDDATPRRGDGHKAQRFAAVLDRGDLRRRHSKHC